MMVQLLGTSPAMTRMERASSRKRYGSHVILQLSTSSRLTSTFQGDPEPIETVAAEPESKLTTAMKANKRVIKGLMKASRIKWEENIEEADESHAAETKSLGERREQIKGHEHILRKRTRLHHRFRRAVAPIHNALRKEDHKEGILISEFFDAVKIERTAIEVRRADKIKKAEEVHVQEYEALVELLQGLQVMARLSGVELDVEDDGDD